MVTRELKHCMKMHTTLTLSNHSQSVNFSMWGVCYGIRLKGYFEGYLRQLSVLLYRLTKASGNLFLHLSVDSKKIYI